MSSSAIFTSIPLLLAFVGIYEFLAPHFKTERQRAYILSTISSTVMTLVSIPYFYTYLSRGLSTTFKLSQEGWMGDVGRYVVVFFGTYLFADLSVGYFRYRSQVGLLTGWIHHSVYIALMIYLLHTRLTPIFLIGSFMELPTFDLAISNLFPTVRNDLRFLSSFFLVRILFNAFLLFDVTLPSSRAVMDGSWLPTTMLALAGAMHVSWFHGGVIGYLKRRQARLQASVSRLTTQISPENQEQTANPIMQVAKFVEPTVLDTALPTTTPGTPEDSPLVTPHTPSQTPFLFPTINLPHLPTVHIPTISLSDFTAVLNKDHLPDPAAFKDAVKTRWEERRGRFVRGGGMGLGLNLGGLGRRRAVNKKDGVVRGEDGDDAVVSVHEVWAD